MKKCCGIIVCLLLFCGASMARADNETVNYTGNAADLKRGPNNEEDVLYPGTSAAPSASGNTVTINYSSGKNPKLVYGGYALTGDATGNTVTLTKGTIKGMLFGARAEKGDAVNNTVTLNGGTVESEIRGGFSQKGEVRDNKVIINKGTAKNYAYGGFAYDGGATKNNSVEVHGGKVYIAYGGVNAVGSVKGDVTGNKVIIRGGTVDMAMGGESRSSASAKVVSRNTVSVYGGKVGFVTGGQALLHAKSVAKNNTVNYYGGDVTGSLFGGISQISKGNTLNMFTSNKSVKYLGWFQTYNFILPAKTKNGAVILKVTDGSESGQAITLSKVKVNVGLKSGAGNVLKKGDKVTLIDSAKGFDTDMPTKGEGLKGFGTIYKFGLTVERGAGSQQMLIATLGGKGPSPGLRNERLKALPEGALGSFALVGQGSEMVAGQGMNSAARAAKEAGTSGPVAFGALGGSMSRYNTGSHVKVEGVNFLAGLGWNFTLNGGGSILTGVFFETGFGNYDAHNSFSAAASVHGSGDTRYFGGGVLGRYTLPMGLYAEGSLRAGNVKNEYSAKDFYSGAGNRAEYDSSVAYFGAHGGVGYL